MALTTTVPVTAEDLLHLPARITFGTWASDWTLLSLWGKKKRRGMRGLRERWVYAIKIAGTQTHKWALFQRISKD